jgi:hypothetical protein
MHFDVPKHQRLKRRFRRIKQPPGYRRAAAAFKRALEFRNATKFQNMNLTVYLAIRQAKPEPTGYTGSLAKPDRCGLIIFRTITRGTLKRAPAHVPANRLDTDK